MSFHQACVSGHLLNRPAICGELCLVQLHPNKLYAALLSSLLTIVGFQRSIGTSTLALGWIQIVTKLFLKEKGLSAKVKLELDVLTIIILVFCWLVWPSDIQISVSERAKKKKKTLHFNTSSRANNSTNTTFWWNRKILNKRSIFFHPRWQR